ncbi:MAG: hypothetical protein KAW45_02210 [Thermoplasmatales archaeon]|nr:hypothetical protein [Thermoplasmatales archaeon]
MNRKNHTSKDNSKLIKYTPILFIVVTVIGIISTIEFLFLKEYIYQNLFDITHIEIMDIIVGFVIRLALGIPISFVLYLLVKEYNRGKIM